jgi:hypothetical protein
MILHMCSHGAIPSSVVRDDAVGDVAAYVTLIS